MYRPIIMTVVMLIALVSMSGAQDVRGSDPQLTVQLPVATGVDPILLRQELEVLGFSPVELHAQADRRWLSVGVFVDEIDAQLALNNLLAEGYFGCEILSLRRVEQPISHVVRRANQPNITAAVLAQGGPDEIVPAPVIPEPLAPITPASSGWPMWLIALGVLCGTVSLVVIAWIVARLLGPVAPVPAVPVIAAPAPAAPQPAPHRLSTPQAQRRPIHGKPLLTPPPAVLKGQDLDKRLQARLPRAPMPLFTDDFDQHQSGDLPAGWSPPEAGVAELAIETNCTSNMLVFRKTGTGMGGLTFCKLPRCGGELMIEFDIACMEKNRYLLGLYFQEGHDFRRSIQTHFNNGPSGMCLMRLHQPEATLPWGDWGRVCYEVNLEQARLTAFLNNERIGEPVDLMMPPTEVDTLVIRTAPETLGVLNLRRIRLWSSTELRSSVVNTPLAV